MLATLDDVEKRLGHAVNPDDALRVDGLLEEASALVEAHVWGSFNDPVPDVVRIVVSRMVARVLEVPPETAQYESLNLTAGPFGRSATFGHGGSGGSPWLSAADKKLLRKFGGHRGGVWSVEMM